MTASVLILGGSGMVGHVVGSFLQDCGYTVTSASRRPVPGMTSVYLDVLDSDSLEKRLAGDYDFVLNFVGILNTDAKSNPPQTVMINSWLPHRLEQLGEVLGFQLIHLSTDCVFSGRHGRYGVEAPRDADDLYGRSKALGEVSRTALTIRTSVIGPDLWPNGVGLFNWFMGQSGTVSGFTNVQWSGVTTLELAKQVERLLSGGNVPGTIQLTNGIPVSKFELLNLFNEVARNSALTIGACPTPVSDKSMRPSGGDPVPSYRSMIQEMWDRATLHKDLYPHYSF